MELLTFLKGMKVDEQGSSGIILRTSSSCGFFGAMVFLAGLAIAGRAAIYALGGGSVFLAVFGLIFGFGLTCAGLMVLTYRKTVIISRAFSKVEYMEYGLFTHKRATYHFRDILHLEVCHRSECIATSPICLWRIKAYVRRGDAFEAICLFESQRAEQAQDLAQCLADWIGIELYQEDFKSMPMKSFTSPVGH